MEFTSFSGYSGNMTFKVSTANAQPLFLHTFLDSLRTDQIFMSRITVVKDLFIEAGLSPRRIGKMIEGSYLDLSDGPPIGIPTTLMRDSSILDDLGRLLARIHKLD